MTNSEYNRLLELKNLIKENKASYEEKKEYLTILYKNGDISKEQYDNFIKDKNADDIINGALIIGGIVLVVWLLSKLFGND